MINICYLVLVHHQPKQFFRLTRALCSETSSIVVHVDKKADLDTFKSVNACSRTLFTPFRKKVNHSGWRQAVTILETLRYAMETTNADYFIFLAGTDYPVRRQDDLIRFLDEVHPLNFINFYPLLHGSWGFEFISKYHFIDFEKELAHSLRPLWFSAKKRIVPHLPDRIPPDPIVPFRGSSRWCLTKSTAKYLVSFHDSKEGKRLQKYLKYSCTADEIYFQTIIFNSPHATCCAGYDSREIGEILSGEAPVIKDEKNIYLHYVDWSENREDPAVLDESDYDLIVRSGKFFACKFLTGKSSNLLDRIDKEVLGLRDS